jgi:hypothetical protein
VDDLHLIGLAGRVVEGRHVWTTSRTQGGGCVRRSVECSHVSGLLLQRSKLLALMKSADRLPHHVNALEAL